MSKAAAAKATTEVNDVSVSVIIPTCNKAEYLELTLASFEKQTHKNFELVICDDGGTDHTAKVVSRFRKAGLNIKYRKQANRGRSNARNEAIQLAEGDVLVFSDDDRITPPEFLTEHARYFANGETKMQALGWQRGILTVWRPDLAVQPVRFWNLLESSSAREELRTAMMSDQPVPLVTIDDVRERLATMVERYGLAERWWEEGCMPCIERFGDELHGFHIPWILGTTGNMSAWREQVISIGLLDESFKGWGIEDTDLCYRLFKDGARTVVGRKAVNFHQAHPTGGGSKWIQWLKNLSIFVHKHDTLEVCLYANFCTGSAIRTIERFNEFVEELRKESADGKLDALLRETYRELLRFRATGLERSGATKLIGLPGADTW